MDGRVDGIQPHSPSFDDTTHAWMDPEDVESGTWRFAGQTTVCKTNTCNDHAAGDRPTYLQLWQSKNGSDWAAGFEALGDLFPFEPNNEPDAGIMNVPDFWKKQETHWPVDFLHFGSDAYWLGHYNRSGPGPNQTVFVPTTPQQQLGPGAGEGHGYYSEMHHTFVWWGWINGHVPAEPGVPNWDSMLTVARGVSFDPGLSTVGDFAGMLRFYPLPTLTKLRSELLVDEPDAWKRGPSGGGVLAVPKGAGDCLDIELNVSFAGGTVPPSFGSIGVIVLGQGSVPLHTTVSVPSAAAAAAADFSTRQSDHGPRVQISVASATGSIASWGAVSKAPGSGCNEVAFLSTPARADAPNASYTLRLGDIGPWIDAGWCSRSLDGSGASWIGPAPKWIGYQKNHSAWVYRASGLFRVASPTGAFPNNP